MTPGLEKYHARAGGDPLRDAFAGRKPVIPWLALQPVDKNEIETKWSQVRETPRRGKSVAYVHVPFCSNHCLFCNFYRNATRRNSSSAYTDAVIREIESEADTVHVREGPVHAVYLGGGTPTDLESADLFRLIQTLRQCLPLAADCEITVEGRATGCSIEKIAACMDAGANRFSFGVQTFDTTVRRRLGRRLASEEIAEFLSGVSALGRATVVCDLIFGLPNQTMESWLRDLETATSLGLDGLDIYCLTLLSGSPLATAIRNGSMPSAAALPEQADLYSAGVDALEQYGWRQLTSAHFADGTRERNLYNQLIKSGAPCLAYGAGAGGSAAGFSYLLTHDQNQYRDLCAQGRKPIGGLYHTGAGHPFKGLITGGLEVGRLNLFDIEKAGLPGLATCAAPLVEQWEAAGLLTSSNGVLRLTRAGQFWHTNLISGLHHLVDVLAPGEVQARNGNRPHVPPLMKTTPIDTNQDPVLEELRARFARNADGVLEMVAAQSGLTTLQVAECLPDSCYGIADGEHFVEIMNELSEWGDILLIVHTPDAIIECAGPLPKGDFGRGFFNLGAGSPIRGHIRAERCSKICLIRRPFMGMETCSIQFFNGHGEAMFKIFVSRDEADALNPGQVARFETLRTRFQRIPVA